MNPVWYMGIMDKTLLLVTMYAATFMYSAHIKWKKPKLQLLFFILTVAALTGLIFLIELVIKNRMGGSAFSFIFNNGIDVVIVVGCVLSMGFIKKHTRGSLLFTGCAAYATFYLANNIYSFFVSFAIGPDGLLAGVGQGAETAILSAVFVVIYVLVYLVCWLVFLRGKLRDISEYAVDKSVFITFGCIFVFNIFFGSFENGRLQRILLFNRAFSCLIMLFVLFNQSRYLIFREENSRLSDIIEKQKQQFNLMKENIEMVNVKAHDIKHFVEIFKRSGNFPEAVVRDLDNISKEYENIYDTGNKALDITLTEKCRDFYDNGIKFSVIADGEAISFMPDVDVYVLFGNLIENAKEAALVIPDPDNRIIGVHLKRVENFISLHVENTFAVKPVFEDGLPRTSKGDALNHGFGTKSIKMVVEKYNGTMKMACDDSLFTVDIAFYVI